MNDKLDCFVLSNSDYKDNDLILQVINKDYGIFSLVTKGAKKINSKNHYMNMCLYEFLFDYKDNKSIFTLKNGKLLKSYFDTNDIKMMSFKELIVEACLKSKEIINADYYDNLLFLFDNLNNENMYLLGCLFFSFLLDEYGISPVVDGCLMCGNKQVVSLSNKQGGFLCKEHHKNEDILEVDRLKKFRHVVKADKDNYEQLLNDELKYDKEDFKLLVEFFIINSDIRLNSYEFFKKI